MTRKLGAMCAHVRIISCVKPSIHCETSMLRTVSVDNLLQVESVFDAEEYQTSLRSGRAVRATRTGWSELDVVPTWCCWKIVGGSPSVEARNTY